MIADPFRYIVTLRDTAGIIRLVIAAPTAGSAVVRASVRACVPIRSIISVEALGGKSG